MADGPGRFAEPIDRYRETISSFYRAAATHREKSERLDELARDVGSLEARAAAVLSALQIERPPPRAGLYADMSGRDAERLLVPTMEEPLRFLEALHGATEAKEILDPKLAAPYQYPPLNTWQKVARFNLERARSLVREGSQELCDMPQRLQALAVEHGRILDRWRREIAEMREEKRAADAAVDAANQRESACRTALGKERWEFTKGAGRLGCIGVFVGWIAGLIAAAVWNWPALKEVGLVFTVIVFLFIQYLKAGDSLKAKREALDESKAEVSRRRNARNELEAAIAEHRRVRPAEIPEPPPETPRFEWSDQGPGI